MSNKIADLGHPSSSSKSIRVVSILEAATVTGPAKNLIELARRVRVPDPDRPDLPVAHLSFVTYVRGSAEPAFVTAVRAAGLEVDVIAERGAFDRSVMPKLRQVLAERGPDIVQTHNVKSHLLFRLMGLRRHYRWIAFQHGYTFTDLKQELYNQLDRFSLPAAHRMVTVCGAFADALVRRGVRRENIRVLHNSIVVPPPVAPALVEEARRRAGAAAGEAVIVTVGRFSKEKGHAGLIDAFARYLRLPDAPAARLVLVGDGPERPAIEESVRAQGLPVSFIGQVSNVLPYYAIATLMALPSHTEGSPNVVLEAMAMDVPVVATAVGGVPEVIAHEETGRLVPPHDPIAFAEAIHDALSNIEESRRMAAHALENVRANFTPEEYKRKMLAVYREVLDQPDP